MDDGRCVSLVELQQLHEALVESVSDDTDGDAREKVKHFIELCVSLGYVLDAPADRSVAQSLISYWVNRQARQARRAARLASEATDVSVEDSDSDSVFELEDDTGASPVGSQKNGRIGTNNQLLAEFDQEAFNQYVVNPAEQWVRSLPAEQQSLVGHIVLRLVTLKNSGEFEAVPGTQLVLEGLPEPELARSFLDKLVRLGVVRRQRRSLDLEEYSLQSLARLRKWTSLALWMQERKQFRDSAQEVLIQLQQADRRKIQPIVHLVRLVRSYMIRIGDTCLFYLSKYVGSPFGIQASPQPISDQVLEQAEYYHDKNSDELKVLYLKRQLDRVNSEINKERFVGISVALGMVLALLAVSIVQWKRAEWARVEAENQKIAAVLAGELESVARAQAEEQRKAATEAKELTEKTAKTCRLLMSQSDAALGMNTMVQDPAGAWLRGIHSFNTIAANITVLADQQLSDKWRESNLWSLGSAGLQSPVLREVLMREPRLVTSPASSSPGQNLLAPAQATVLSENGQTCMMVDASPERVTVRLSSILPDGKWKTNVWRIDERLELEDTKEVKEHSVSAFISPHGVQVAFVHSAIIKSKKDGATTGSTTETVSRLFVGQVPQDSQALQKSTSVDEPVALKEKFATVGTACFDADDKYFALAFSADASQNESKLTVWSTANWEELSSQPLPPKGRVQSLAFATAARTDTGNSRNVIVSDRIQLAAAVDSVDGLSILRLDVPTIKVTPQDQPQWHQTLLTAAYNPDSPVVLRYSPQNTILFCSHNGAHFLLDAQQEKKDGSGAPARTGNGTAQCRVCAFNADGSSLALGFRDGKVLLWNIKTHQNVLTKATVVAQTDVALPGHPHHGEEIFGIGFAPDGKHLLSCGRDKQVQVYDLDAHQTVSPPIVHNATVNAAIVSPDGRFLTTLTRDIVYCWEFPSTRWLNDSWPIPAERAIHALAKSSSNCLAVGGKRGDKFVSRGWIRVCPTLLPEDRPLDEIDVPRPVQNLAISENGHWVVAGDDQGSVNLFYKSKKVWEQDNKDMYVRLIAFDSNAKEPRFFLCGESSVYRTSILKVIKPVASEDNQVAVSEVGNFRIPVHESGTPTVVGFDSWEGGCVVGTQNGRLYYCTGQDQVIPLTVQDTMPHRERVTQVAFHREKKLIVSGAEDDRVAYWQIADDRWATRGYLFEKANGADITSLAVSPSGNKLAAASADGRAVIWKRHNDTSPFKQFFTILPSDTGVNSANAMEQVGFVEGIADERFVLCRRSDSTVRVFETLQIGDPLNPEQLLLDGREVASFSIPHRVQSAELKIDKEGNWALLAIGFDNLKTESSKSDVAPSDAQSVWKARVGLSARVVHPFPEKILAENNGHDIQDLASLVSGRQMRGQLRPLAALDSQQLFAVWNSTKIVRSQWPSNSPLDHDEWHLREAQNAATNSSASKWHFERMSKLTSRARVQFASSLGPAESMRALEQLKTAESELGESLDFLSLRASLSCKTPSTLDSAIGDYRKIMAGNPQDLITHIRLTEALDLKLSVDRHSTKDQIQKRVDELLLELDAIINSSSFEPPPNVVKMRGAIRSKYTEDFDKAIEDMIKSGDLYLAWQDFKAAYGQFMGAIKLIDDNHLNEAKKTELATAHRKLGDYYSWLESSSNRVSKKALESYYKACQVDATNVQNFQAFFNCLLRAEEESSPMYSWTEVDQLFEKAITLDNENADFYRQRIAALLRMNSQTQALDQRLELVVQVFKKMELGPGLSTNDYIHFAGLYLHLDRVEEAEQLLTEAWKKQPGNSLLGARLGVVLAMQNKQQALKLTVETMAKHAETIGDKNNVAWTASFVEMSPAELKPLVEFAEAAVKEFGSNANYLNTLGAIYVRASEYLNAIPVLEQATQQREALPDYLASSDSKLYGNALDLVISSIALRALEDFESADERLESALQQFNRYRESQSFSTLQDSEWNIQEFELLLKQAQY